jgi:Prolyl oligopeptidase family
LVGLRDQTVATLEYIVFRFDPRSASGKMMDDNVNVQNTMQQMDALPKANRDFEVMLYPHARHGIGGKHYQRLQIEFMKRALQPSEPLMRLAFLLSPIRGAIEEDQPSTSSKRSGEVGCAGGKGGRSQSRSRVCKWARTARKSHRCSVSPLLPPTTNRVPSGLKQ